MDNSKKIELLKKKVEFIEKKQVEFQTYISNLKEEINALEPVNSSSSSINPLETIAEEINATQKVENKPTQVVKESTYVTPKKTVSKSYFEKLIDDLEIKSNLENFIGTNLINKIGILILIFGVIIGSKYAIDNDLISPLARVILGYVISVGLLLFAIKLKPKYLNFSAVLLSGALTLLYFLSFIAYDFYHFIPQTAAFGLMLVFTIFAVLASLNYNKQVIALIGLVGSYAIPFLLSNDSGNILFLFSYMSIINIGILFISFKKYWKPLFYSAFFFTWFIFLFWFGEGYKRENFIIGMSFASIFFLIFYTTFIAYKVIKKEAFAKVDVIFILLNSFIYFSLGYFIMEDFKPARDYLGLFAIVNALIHFVVSKVFFTRENTDEKIFYLALGLVFVFITMAIPIQLDGNWVTLLWSLEALLLFWLGRTKQIKIYEIISYPLILLSFFSLWQDWTFGRYYHEIKAFINPIFLTALISSISYALINYFHFKNPVAVEKRNKKQTILNIALPILFSIAIYFTFAVEIGQWFSNIFDKTSLEINDGDYIYHEYNYDITKFKELTLLFYTIIFVLLATLINFKKIKSTVLSKVSLAASLLLLFFALSAGLLICSELRASYLLPETDQLFNRGSLNLYIRYFNFAFIALLVYSIYIHLKKEVVPPFIGKYFGVLVHLVVLWFLSSELLHWLDIFGNKNAYKLALSILWGSYSLLMVVLGLWKNLKYTRIAAIALFAITLLKLFAYDISNLSTIYKTIVLIILGVLLLVISFLYNKYAKTSNQENED